jgi:hypothetical protein
MTMAVLSRTALPPAKPDASRGTASTGSFQNGSTAPREAGRKGGKETKRRQPVRSIGAGHLRRPLKSKIEPEPRVKKNTDTATRILRGMVLSLLDNGFEKQDVAAALDRLADEARRDVLETFAHIPTGNRNNKKE